MPDTREPHVAGVAGGVGTSVVAAALGAADHGVYVFGLPVDVLVCRATVESLGKAHEAVQHTHTRPVLVVVADVPGGAAAGVRARVRMVHPYVEAVVVVPFLGQLRELSDPYAAAGLVLLPDVTLPREVRPFAASMWQIVKCVEPLLATGVSAAVSGPSPVPGRARGSAGPSSPLVSAMPASAAQ